MSQISQVERRFSVHVRDEDHQHSHTLAARGFEDAALAFVEHWHPPVTPDGDIAVIVADCDSGEERCFLIDAGTGNAEPCG